MNEQKINKMLEDLNSIADKCQKLEEIQEKIKGLNAFFLWVNAVSPEVIPFEFAVRYIDTSPKYCDSCSNLRGGIGEVKIVSEIFPNNDSKQKISSIVKDLSIIILNELCREKEVIIKDLEKIQGIIGG